MDGNNGSTAPASSNSPHEGKLSKAVSAAESIYERFASMGGLAIFALVLVPVVAVLLYAVFVNSREKSLAEANGKIDAAMEAYRKGEIDESLKIIREVGNSFSNLKIARIARYYEGAILFTLEEDKESLKQMENFLSGSPDEMLMPDALFMAGLSSFRLENWEKSVGYFEKLLSAENGFQERVLPLLGTAYMKTGDREKAEAVYARYAAAFPKSEDYLSGPGNSAE